MPTPTVPVTVTLAYQDGTPCVGVTVRARLDVNEVYEGVVISAIVDEVTDENGIAVLNLFPNAPAPTGLGTQGSTYRVSAQVPNGFALNVDARVPNAACNLEDILVNSDPVTLDAAELAVLQAQAASTAAGESATAAAAYAAFAEAQAAAAVSVNTGRLTDGYDTAFLIDATTDDTDAAVVTKIDAAVSEQSLFDAYNTGWADAVMRVLKDSTVGWSDHNLITHSNNLGDGAYFGSGVAKTVGQEGPSGQLDALLLTTNASPGFLQVSLSGAKIANFNGNYFLGAWKVRYDGTHRWAYLRIDSPGTKRVYFDLQTGVVGTVDAGITGFISRYDSEGELLPSGWYMIWAYQLVAAASFLFDVGLSDADANPAVTIGKTLRVAEPQVCYGVKRTKYLPSGALAVYGAPYSWEPGIRCLLQYVGATYSGLWSEDLTNAVWVKTNCTPLFTSTGISGEPCSKLTATAPNATCLQATVSAGAVQTFQPYVRRKTGVGAIFITMDNGATWTDITAQLNSVTYKRVYLHGALANPTIGFKIATTGDEIEICHANNAQSAFVVPPLTVWGAARTMGPSALVNKAIPVPLAGNVLAYYDAYLVDDTAILSPTIWTGVSLDSSSTPNMLVNMNETLNFRDAGGQTINEVYGAKEAGERVEVTVYLGGQADGNYGSINGEPSAVDYQRTVTGLNRFSMGNGSAMQFIRRLLIASATLDDRDQVRTKHYEQGIKNNLYAAAIVAGAHEFASYPQGTDYERFPVVSMLKDYGNSALLGVFWAARDVDHYAPEFAIRLMQRNFVYDKVENTLVPVTDAAIVCQPSRWSLNLGGSESPVVIRLRSGPNAGRLIMLFNELDSVSGTLVDDKRNVYIKTNDLEGDPSGWTAATKLFDASVIGATAMLFAPGGDHVILPPNHPVAPNRIVTMYYAGANRVGSIYSDDFGATWNLGTVLVVAAPGATEPTLALWPDGSLVSTTRGGTGLPNTRQWLKSVDGGVNFVNQGLVPSLLTADSSASTVQLDPTGLTSPQGRIALSHSQNNLRTKFQIRFANDSTMEFSDYIEPVNDRRWFAYSSLCDIFGGEYLACAVEYGSYGNVEIYPSVCLMIVKP